ncbi:hypothetical protein AMATHDRAFT_60196 [Amanita thiersii Skay4041]|uniref:Uncharacterized protein n=1 Tax=Amanita thiersii Skay4041 TaxID=703135 RepID=A0A2A9NNT3_9AGAR|nr:hypothetical protein AMATHDRAFT_60196 [Amanita thiersii Skay4041]
MDVARQQVAHIRFYYVVLLLTLEPLTRSHYRHAPSVVCSSSAPETDMKADAFAFLSRN